MIECLAIMSVSDLILVLGEGEGEDVKAKVMFAFFGVSDVCEFWCKFMSL